MSNPDDGIRLALPGGKFRDDLEVSLVDPETLRSAQIPVPDVDDDATGANRFSCINCSWWRPLAVMCAVASVILS